jgi:hypothetical protein
VVGVNELAGRCTSPPLLPRRAALDQLVSRECPVLCSPRPASEPGVLSFPVQPSTGELAGSVLSCAALYRRVSRECPVLCSPLPASEPGVSCLVSGAVAQGGALVTTTWAPWGLPRAHGASPLGALF